VCGVTDFAQSELGEIVFAELPSVGSKVSAGGSFCVLESTKAASDVYAPISGTVSEVNQAVSSDPTLVNKEPFGAGWLVKLRDFKSEDLDGLMTPEQYKAHISR
jgi:glycine cleavage system H protein